MKKYNALLFILPIFLGILISANAQQVTDPNGATSDGVINSRCSTMPALAQRIAADPAYAAFHNQYLSEMQAGTNRSNIIDCDGTNSITIPIAFHFDASFSCADPQCLIDETNEAIVALNASFGDNTTGELVQDLNAACPSGYPIANVSTGTCIDFCLGTPRGGAANDGIDPTCDPAITIGEYCGGRNYTTDGCVGGAAPYWTGFLNIFVVDGAGSGLLGVADGIPGMGNADGVTVIGSVFGADDDSCNSGGPINTSGLFGGGATLAHEVGHYLGLFHIWGDDAGACGNAGDQINDTPDQGDNSQGIFPCPFVGTSCAGLPFSCGSNDYYHNYMDYTSDDCLVMFTQEQAQVMNNTAFQLFGNTTAVCDPDPLVELTTLCEQQVCNVNCELDVTIESECNASGADYTVTVTITGGTGPFTIDETAENDPSTILQNLDTGVSTGTYTYTFPDGTNTNIVVTDTGVANCFNGQFIFNSCALCDFDIVVDYDNVTCVGGSPQIAISVVNAEGTVWIDQDGNNTFDPPPAGPDIEITGATIGFPQDDLTLDFYDNGALDCVKTFSILSGNYFCDGVADGDSALLFCAFEAAADTDNFVCNPDGTATVPITVTNTYGNVTFSDPNVTGTGPDYEIVVETGANCAVTTVIVADDGSDVSLNSGVDIISPPAIAGTIFNFGTNVVTDWGIDINTVTPCVSGVLRPPTDGTPPETNFCEPTPPTPPTPAQCGNVAGNIAIIDRGLCFFTEKVENALACGAIAVVICNCLPFSPDCNSTDPNEIINMSGTTVNPVTIPVVSLSYNQCLEIYAEMATGDVEMCLGAPGPSPCERTIAIDACAFTCDPGQVEYCSNPCFVEYEPNPAPGDVANDALCVTALGCADNPDAACLSTQACDDGDSCTEGDEGTVVTETGEVCACSGTPIDPCGVSIDITDPCSCGADENIDLDGDGIFDLFYEVITITAPAGIADWNGVFANGTPLDMSGNPFTGVITDNGDGTYTIAFYLAAGDSYSANFTSASSGFDLSISGGGCEPCPLVPTLSQWGLIVLCLLLMCFGAIQMATVLKRETILA